MTTSAVESYEYALLCNGASIASSTYYELYSKIGGTLPDMRSRVPQGTAASGETVGAYKAAGLPNITGYAYNIPVLSMASSHVGVFINSSLVTSAGSMLEYAVSNINSAYYSKLNFNAGDSNAIYGASTTVQPPAMLVNFYICYA